MQAAEILQHPALAQSYEPDARNVNVALNQLHISVVAPCYNEANNIPELVARLRAVFSKRGLRGEIVLVNDASTDNTGALIDDLARQYPEITGIHHERNRGIEGGWNSGVAAAKGEFICLIDADLQNLPEDVWRLYREIQHTNADIVQGFRSSIGRLKDSRYTLSKGLNLILNTLFGMRARDNKSGFVIARKEVMQDILRHRFNYRYFQSFITVSAKAKGYRIHEIETLFESRLLGESFIPSFPVKTILFCLFDIVKGFVEFRLFPKRENILADYLATHPPTRSDSPLPLAKRFWFELFFMTMPLHKWLITRKARHYYLELKQSQWLTLEQMRELQLRKLRRLVHHAYYHVPFYRQQFDANGVTPDDIQSLDDLTKLPLLSKQDVRENLYFDLLSETHDKKKILKIQTSGSTGEPFVCFADQDQLEIRWAATQRSIEWAGCEFGDRQVRLWHQTLGMTPLQVFREKCDAWFNNRLFIPAYEMSDRNIGESLKKIEEHNPVFIDGYAESFNFLAHYLKDKGGVSIRPRGIMSSAQALPEQSRQIIEEAFGCKVYDKYGSREFSGIAYECEAHAGHHVVAESYIVEILKDGRPAQPGEIGEVVITDLNNFCMPFIRYRVGDLAEAIDNTQPCSCGRGLPRVGHIEGRVQAIIVGTNGNYVPGTFFAHLFKDYDFVIRQYQVLQEELGSVTLKVIKGQRFDQGVFNEILKTLRHFLGEDMRFDIQFVDEIPMVRTGKQQGSISKLKLDFQNIRSDLATRRDLNNHNGQNVAAGQ